MVWRKSWTKVVGTRFVWLGVVLFEMRLVNNGVGVLHHTALFHLSVVQWTVHHGLRGEWCLLVPVAPAQSAQQKLAAEEAALIHVKLQQQPLLCHVLSPRGVPANGPPSPLARLS
jgi:hypothetical protein